MEDSDNLIITRDEIKVITSLIENDAEVQIGNFIIRKNSADEIKVRRTWKRGWFSMNNPFVWLLFCTVLAIIVGLISRFIN